MSYVVREGDTFSTAARNVYGDDTRASVLRGANPGVIEPLRAGTVLTTPPSQSSSNRPQPLPASSVDEVAMLLDGTRFRYWQRVSVGLSLDAPSTVEFDSPWDPDNATLRTAFRPFRFPPLSVTVGGEALFSGTLVNPEPTLGERSITMTASGYATCGVLQDATAPPSVWPVEYDNLTLDQIATSVCEPFGLVPVFDAPVGAAFQRVALDAGEIIWMWLSDLAKQRGLIIRSNAEGQPLFTQPQSEGPVARLIQGQPPITEIRPTFNPQEYYSHVTAHKPTLLGDNGGEYTAKNPFTEDVLRPFVFEPSDTEEGDVRVAAEAKLARMFANMVTWEIDVIGWRTPGGQLFEPGQTVTLLAPAAMVYTETELLVREIILNRDDSAQTATLTVCLPGGFSGETPESLPWD